jgi:tetratricopeptide (TPR) repeat protein
LGLITSTVLYFQAEKARENETAARLEATQQRDRAIVAEAEAVRQRDSAQTQRERAEGNFQMARDAVDEMIQVAEHKLAVAPGMEQVRRELLEKAQIFYAGFLQDNIGDLEIREEIGRAYKQLGDINKELGQYEQAEQAYRKAIEVFGELTDEFPDEENYRMELAISENALGFVLQELGLHEEADDAYRTGIEVSGALAADFPNEPDYLDVLFDSHFSRGLLLVSVGRYEEAEQAYRQALEIREKLGADFSVLPHGVTAITHLHWRLSELLNEMGRRQEAAEVLHQAVANLEKLVTESPDEPKYHAELARRLDTLRWLLRESRHLEPELMTKAMSHTLRAVELDPMETLYRRELASQSELLGGALVALNRHDEARQTYEQAIALLENLLNVAPSCRYELLMILVDLAYLLENTGRTEEAQVVYSRAETVRRELLSRFPNLPYDNREASATFDGHVNAFVEYRVRITTVGEYRLYVRGAGHDLKSDSFIAWIEELCDGPGGPIADCYRYEPRADADFGTGVWQGSASREGGGYNIGSERFGTTIWSIRVPGDYTIHVVGREDGAAIDALAFQLATLPAPKGQGPEESQVIKGRVFLEVGGQMVAEAENFSSRTPRKGNWLIIPGEDPGDVAHKNFRGAGYIQALPDRTLSFEERLDYCTRAIEARPNEATAYDQRGDLYLLLGQWNEAISDFTKAIELGSDNFSVLNEIAWLLATSQEYGLRDGKKAVEYATKACELTDWENPMIVDTLAAAYAEVGDFTEAVKWQKKAVEFLSEEDPHGILGGVELRLKLYEAGKPYR